MSIVTTFLRLAKQTFLSIAVALILFFVLIEILFYLNSWILYMPILDIVKEVAMMIVLMSFVSACLALMVAAVGCALIVLFAQKPAQKVEESVIAVAAIGSLAIIALFLLRMLKVWFEQVTGIAIRVGEAKPLLLLLVMAGCGFWIWKFGLLATGDAIRSRLARGNRAALSLIIVAVAVVAASGIAFHDYHEIQMNPVSAPRAHMPNVILLSIDTLTAGDMSLYGYPLPTTPKLSDFAKESYTFDHFFASSNWTTPTIASFISGLYPVTNGVHQSRSYFLRDDRRKNLGQALKDNGYQTAAVIANSYAHPLLLRITDSFSATTESPEEKYLASDPLFRILLRLKDYGTALWLPNTVSWTLSRDDENSLFPPELIFDRALPFFSSLKQPYFVWAHIFPPHSPYLPAAPFKYRFGNFKEFSKLEDYDEYPGTYPSELQSGIDKIRLRYDEFILDTDFRVGGFLDKLKALGRFEDSVIIVTADHGESFTRNVFGHNGPLLHQPLIHIPLLIHLPGQKEGKRIPYYAGQVDLLPTVMDLLDLPIPTWVQGESLKSAMLDGTPTSLPKFSMNLDLDSRFAPPTKGTFAVMQDGWKFVRYLATGKEELYHLASDPGEIAELAGDNPEQAKKMRDLIEVHFNLTDQAPDNRISEK